MVDRETPVRKACIKRLEQWKSWGVVVDIDDVFDLGKRVHRGRWTMKTEKGKRDIIAIFKVKNIAWVYLVECKAPTEGNWSKEQQSYSQRFAWLDNVVYEVINDPSQIDITLERITGRSENLLNSMGV